MLTFQHVAASYDKAKPPVLSDVTLSPLSGTMTALVGRNGCGKSTLLSCVNGTMAYTGEIALDGVPLSSMTRRERAVRIAFLPQFLPKTPMTVGELVALGRSPHLGLMQKLTKEDRRLCRAAMEETGMVNYASTPVASLSGGERQRAYLAMVLAQDTDVILLDEPTAYLDVGSRTALYRLLHHLRDSCGKTILAVIHDLSDAVRCCDRVALLDGGKICCEGPSYEVIPAIEDVFSVRAHRFSDADGEYTIFI